MAEVAGRYCDGISIDLYNKDLGYFKSEVQRLHDASGLPVMLGEYSYVARNNRSGDDNHWYSSCEVDTDAQRGQLYDRTLHMVADIPYVVGAFWFQFFDEPPKGRHDGESSNFGLVDVNNVVYDDLANAVTQANQDVLRQRQSVTSR